MPRTYGEEFLIALYEPGEKTAGQILALACIKANIPAAFAAKALGVSRITIHGWFRGKRIRSGNLEKVNAFMSLLVKDAEVGLLPANSVRHAKEYIEEMIGKKF